MTPKLPEEQEVPEALILIYYRNPNVEQTWQHKGPKKAEIPKSAPNRTARAQDLQPTTFG